MAPVGLLTNAWEGPTKVNPSRPVVEDDKGNSGCFWKLNLKKVGTKSSRFGHCSICDKPSEYAWPCPYGAPGGKRCPGVMQGKLNWRLWDLTQSAKNCPEKVVVESMSTFLTRQFGAALKRLGLSEFSEELIAPVRLGMREATSTPQGLALVPLLG